MNTPIFDANDGLNEEFCLSIYDNSYDFYVSVLKAFYKESLETVPKMEKALSDKEYEEYRILVHGLKGSGGAIGDDKLLDMATESNALIKAGNIEEGIAFHDRIISELKRIQDLIERKVLS